VVHIDAEAEGFTRQATQQTADAADAADVVATVDTFDPCAGFAAACVVDESASACAAGADADDWSAGGGVSAGRAPRAACRC